MKKTMLLIVLFVLAFSATIAVAEDDFNFSAFSYDELISVKEKLDAEIQLRPEAGERILQSGQYVVGKDIAQGVYELGFVAAEEDDTYTNWTSTIRSRCTIMMSVVSGWVTCRGRKGR